MKNGRDVSVEFLRIVACFVVIGTHSKLTTYVLPNNEIDFSVLLISDFFGEGVGIFFLIMGFFYFNNKSAKKLLKRVLITLIIPAFVTVFFTQLLYYYIKDSMNIIESIMQFDLQLKNIVKKTVEWDIGSIRYCGHLGFVVTYLQCALCFPLVCHLGEHEKTSYRRYVIAMGFVALCLSDLQRIVTFDIGQFKGYSLVPVAVMMVLIGHELYLYKDVFKNKQLIRILSIVLYFILHLLNTVCNQMILKNHPTGARFVWYNSLQILSAICLAVFVLSFEIKEDRYAKIIAYIGKNTFYIYLIHQAVILKFKYQGFYNHLYNKCIDWQPNAIGELFFVIMFTFIVFIVCLILVSFYILIKEKISNILARLKHNTV